MKKILITGASGFIGSTLVEEALQYDDWEVHAGIRATSSKKYLSDPRIHFFAMNFADIADLIGTLAPGPAGMGTGPDAHPNRWRLGLNRPMRLGVGAFTVAMNEPGGLNSIHGPAGS